MARGPKKHLKRLNAPRAWMLSKLGGIYAPRPSAGPHKLRECIPISVILRNHLKYALTRREVQSIVMGRHVTVDGKTRTDLNYPCGFMDIVSLDAAKETYRVLYNTKGRFHLFRVNDEEAKFKLLRVNQVSKSTLRKYKDVKGHGQQLAYPYIVTHDGRTIRFPDPLINVNDTVKFDLENNKIVGHYRFEPKALCMITRGKNLGRIGTIEHIERHPGSFDIIHLVDSNKNKFATRLHNVFVIGAGHQAAVALPSVNKKLKEKLGNTIDFGVKRTILEERAVRELIR